MEVETRKVTIDAGPNGRKLNYGELNKEIRKAAREGYNWITLTNVQGQRFISAGMKDKLTIEIFGDVGLDTGIFSEGPNVIVHGCSEYLLGNTLNGGEIVVYGDSWDITGMGARGGEIYVMGDGGSRIGIHMKEYKDKKPVIVYGGRVKQYCGEYMAGGIIVVLGLDFHNALIDNKKPITKDNINPAGIKNYGGEIIQSHLGGGIHGGTIYIRGDVPDYSLGVYATKDNFTGKDTKILAPILGRFSELFNVPMDLIWSKKFSKIRAISTRPFGTIYNPNPI